MTDDLGTLDEHGICIIGETRARDVSVEEVGAKAYNLMRMHESGLPVPPGFTLRTGLCREYYDSGQHLEKRLADLVVEGVRGIERLTGSCFGTGTTPCSSPSGLAPRCRCPACWRRSSMSG